MQDRDAEDLTYEEWYSTVVPELEKLAEEQNMRRLWSKEDDKVLLSYYGRVKTVDLAKYLNRTPAATAMRWQRLGGNLAK